MLIDHIASALIVPFCFITSLPEKLNRHIRFSIYITSLAIVLLLYFLIGKTSIFKFVLYIDIIACLLLTALFSKERLLNSLSAIIGYITTVVLNNVLLLFLDIVFDISVIELYSNLYILIVFYLINFILIFIACRFLRMVIKKLDFVLLRKYKVSHLILAELLICMAILILNISYGNLINYPSETIYFNCILFLLYFILSIALIGKIIKSTKQVIIAEEKEKQYAELESYIKLVDENNQQLRKFKHDYLNILFTLDLLIKEKNVNDLERYYNEHILTTRQDLETSSEVLAPLSYISDMPIRSLLFSKLNQAISKHIKVDVSINDNISIPLLKPIESARILGILLDNAIEATIKSPNPEISFSCVESDTCCEIVISNTFDSNTDIHIENIMENGFSTKGDDRGMGLANVEEILDEYEKILTNISVEENIFTFTITIEK